MGIPQGNPMPRRHAPWRACPVPGGPSRAPQMSCGCFVDSEGHFPTKYTVFFGGGNF